MIWQEKRIKEGVLKGNRQSFTYNANAGLKPGSIPSKGKGTWRIVQPVVCLFSSRTKTCWSESNTVAPYVPINRKGSPAPEVIPPGVWYVEYELFIEITSEQVASLCFFKGNILLVCYLQTNMGIFVQPGVQVFNPVCFFCYMKISNERTWVCLYGFSYEQIFFSMVKGFGSTMSSAILLRLFLVRKPLNRAFTMSYRVRKCRGSLRFCNSR